jgi:hypothetical protein
MVYLFSEGKGWERHPTSRATLGNLSVVKDELRSYKPAENAVKLAAGDCKATAKCSLRTESRFLTLTGARWPA